MRQKSKGTHFAGMAEGAKLEYIVRTSSKKGCLMPILFMVCLAVTFTVLESYLIYCVEKKSPAGSAKYVTLCCILWGLFYYFSHS